MDLYILVCRPSRPACDAAMPTGARTRALVRARRRAAAWGRRQSDQGTPRRHHLGMHAARAPARRRDVAAHCVPGTRVGDAYGAGRCVPRVGSLGGISGEKISWRPCPWP
jgi:hypothetical protein